MKPRFPFIYSLLVSFCIITFSCKKENTTYPTIEIIAPEPGQSFGYQDTIRVKTIITNRDGNAMVYVMKGSSVINFDWEKVFDNGRHVDFEIYCDQRYMESGKYDLKVSVFNGNNQRSEFVEVNLEELPRKRTGLMILSRNGNNAHLTYYQEEGNISSISLDGDYSYLAFNGFQQRVAVAPVFNGKLHAFDTLLMQQYEIPRPTLPGQRQYNFLTSHGNITYSYEHEGYIRGWTASGTPERSYRLPAEHVPVRAVFGEPGMLVNVRETGTKFHKIFLLNPVNGAVLKEKSVQAGAVDMLYLGKSRFLLALKKEENTEMEMYDPVNNTLTAFDKIMDEEPQCMVALEEGEVLLSTDQRIYKLNPLTAVLPSVLYNFAAVDMEYDPINKEVIYGRDFGVYKATPGELPQSILSINDSIKELKITYNK